MRRSRGDDFVPLTPAAQQAVRALDTLGELGPNEYLWYARPGGGTVLRRDRPISDTAFFTWYDACLKKARVRYRKPETTRRVFEKGRSKPNLADDTRLSFLGPAGEVRELMRAAIHQLAPDDDVRAQRWFVGHEGRPTQTERIRYILEARSEAETSAAEAAEVLEAKVARLDTGAVPTSKISGWCVNAGYRQRTDIENDLLIGFHYYLVSGGSPGE